MPRDVARIPPDLRARKDLTLDTIEQVQAIRTERKRLQTKLDGMPTFETNLRAQIADTVKAENAILGTPKS